MRAGICRPPSYKGAQDEHYSIPYFQPTRHMAPCITNAQCNMSPIIPIYFIVFKSMCNAQIISQTSGVLKYILKYIAKIDKCNYVFVFANGRNEDLRVCVQFLHNTKISTSAINETKAPDRHGDSRYSVFTFHSWLLGSHYQFDIPSEQYWPI